MMQLNNSKIAEPAYSRICIVEDRNMWNACTESFDKTRDLILCVDFGLKKELQDSGYNVEFIDHLVTNTILEELNYTMHNFLNNWFKDANGADLLKYRGLDLGDAHLLYIINEVDYFCHFFFNIIALGYLKYDRLMVLVHNNHTIYECLNVAGLAYEVLTPSTKNETGPKPVYLFPILKWVAEKTNKASLIHTLKNAVANCFDFTYNILDRINRRDKKYVYIHRYHPTVGIVDELQKVKNVQLVFNNYSGLTNILNERRIHFKAAKDNSKTVNTLLESFTANRCGSFKYNEYDVTAHVYKIIDKILADKLGHTISTADSIIDWFKNNKLDLMIPITNLWTENRLIMKYCQANNVPVFMIINGLLTFSYYQDAKDSDYVNCYSESIREQYFNNSASAVPLGDPRMDNYANIPLKEIDYNNPTIVVGTAGFNPVDLNSYLAFEFDFLFDILHNVQLLNNTSRQIKVILKIRGNGYVHLYQSFVNEYFPNLGVELIQDAAFTDVIKKADLYISIYSQTLFEASCMGVPVIYYKKDTQVVHKPFDGNSELVTAQDSDGLLVILEKFLNHDPIFEPFKQKEVMQQYVGFIDGGNTKRNVDYILNLVR